MTLEEARSYIPFKEEIDPKYRELLEEKILELINKKNKEIDSEKKKAEQEFIRGKRSAQREFVEEVLEYNQGDYECRVQFLIENGYEEYLPERTLQAVITFTAAGELRDYSDIAEAVQACIIEFGLITSLEIDASTIEEY